MAYKVNVFFTLFLTLLAAGPTTAFQMEVVPVVSGELVVLENQPIGSHLAYLKVTGRAGEVQCRVRDSEVLSIQQINSTFYDIVTSAVFDRETPRRSSSLLQCFSEGDGRMEGIRLNIQIREATVNLPTAGSTLQMEIVPDLPGGLTVLEHRPVGSHLAYLKVDGAVGVVQCRVRSSNVVLLQKLTSTFYNIVTRAVFDHETQDEYAVRLECESDGDGRYEEIYLQFHVRESADE